jgi:hypothetical protein
MLDLGNNQQANSIFVKESLGLSIGNIVDVNDIFAKAPTEHIMELYISLSFCSKISFFEFPLHPCYALKLPIIIYSQS